MNKEYKQNTLSAIEQAVKALEAAVTYLEERGIRHKGTTGRTVILPALDDALASLRALTEPVAVSKTDGELAREFSCACISSSSDGCEKQFGKLCGCCQKRVALTQAFTAIRVQARSEAFNDVVEYGHQEDGIDASGAYFEKIMLNLRDSK